MFRLTCGEMTNAVQVEPRKKSDIMGPVLPQFPVPRKLSQTCEAPQDCYSLQRDSESSAWNPEGLVFDGLIGKGAHGTVHKALMGGDIVAVKIVVEKESEIKDLRKGSCAAPESELMHGINHPNLIQVYGVQCFDGVEAADIYGVESALGSTFNSDIFSSPCHMEGERRWFTQESQRQTWVIMEYCDAGSLWDAIRSGDLDMKSISGSPNYSSIIGIAMEVALGMSHLHKQGIVHGDLKAQNVMLKKSKTSERRLIAKIGDFGLSRRPKGSRMEMTTFSVGTVDHMAPETLQAGKLHGATDVFSFGMLLLELMTGHHPFHGMTTPAVLVAIVQGMRPKIPQSCPLSLSILIEDCWNQDWRKRPTFSNIVMRLATMMQFSNRRG